jgi:hypothetical protein
MRIYDIFDDKDYLYLLQGLLPGGTLEDKCGNMGPKAMASAIY